jgi:hypothetical protein
MYARNLPSMPGIGVLVKSEASYVQSEAPRTRTPIICTHQIVDSNSEPAHHFAQRIDELKTEPLSNPYEKQRTNPMGHAINQSMLQIVHAQHHIFRLPSHNLRRSRRSVFPMRPTLLTDHLQRRLLYPLGIVAKEEASIAPLVFEER